MLIRLGLGVLFGKLYQGVAENQQILTIARMRAEAEDIYGLRLSEIGPATDRIAGGFSRDDGASVRKASTICQNSHWEIKLTMAGLRWGSKRDARSG